MQSREYILNLVAGALESESLSFYGSVYPILLFDILFYKIMHMPTRRMAYKKSMLKLCGELLCVSSNPLQSLRELSQSIPASDIEGNIFMSSTK